MFCSRNLRAFFPTVLAVSLSISLSQARAKELGEAGPYRQVVERLDAMSHVKLSNWAYHDDNLPHAELPGDISGWQKIEPREPRGGQRAEDTTGLAPSATGWVCRWVEIPKDLGGYDTNGRRLRIALNADGDRRRVRIFVNGMQAAYFDWDISPVVVSNSVRQGEKYYVAMLVETDGTHDKVFRFTGADLYFDSADSDVDPAMMRDEIYAAEKLVSGSRESSGQAAQLDAAVKAVDFGALDRGDQKGFQGSLRKAQEELQQVAEWARNTYQIKAVGNAHMDMAWLWPWTETVEVVRNTYSTVLQLMRQYPDFTYSQSQVRTYEWMEEKYPEIFREIQQRVKEGRWELVGGMWVEPDLNMPDGESFVRQLLVGQRYFQEKFGKQTRVGWNPDSFGYNWQLPQIYKKAGIDYFVTQKMSWNDTTQFPYKIFWWQSPDGSKLLTYFPRDYVNTMEPRGIAQVAADYRRKTNTPEMLWLYGVGDHGGGPTREMLDTAIRWENPKLVFPNVKFSSAQSFFNDLEREVPSLNLPTWSGELYFQKHRGVQTSQSLVKRWNRKNEALLMTTEKLSSMALLMGMPYPQVQLNAAWKNLLFNQFHDILPGSGIHNVYVEADRDHQEIARSAGDALKTATSLITDQIDTRGSGIPVVIFNPLSWDRNGMVEMEMPALGAGEVSVTDSTGKTLLAETIDPKTAWDKTRVRVLASVPAMGYSVVHVQTAKKPQPSSDLRAEGTTLENEKMRVTVNRQSGCITSLYNKAAHYEAIAEGACGNLLQTFVDKPREYDAWDIDASFEDKKWDLDHADSVELVEKGSTRAAIRVKKHFQGSSFVQDVVLYAGSDHVDVENDIDWREKHILLKAAFPLAAHNDKASFEIPYGNIQRPTTRNTPEERAMFEVPALRWADLSDERGGFSLLNDSKYGYDVKGNVLRLSLLRSPEWPDPHPSDEGRNRFTYSLYPHAGNWKQAETVRHGYELNYPVETKATYSHAGSLQPAQSFMKIDARNVVLSSMKKAEDDDNIIFRFYEYEGKESEIKLALPRAAERAQEVNLLEIPQGDLKVEDAGKVVVVPIKPYEIKSVKIKFRETQAQGEKESPDHEDRGKVVEARD